jgi:hypothetical protein
MKVLVCGGRAYNDYGTVYVVLSSLEKDGNRVTEIIHGGASGADELAGKWAREMRVPEIVFHADWKSHARAAGPIRNSHMLAYGPDLIVAFPGGRGTADMVSKAKRANVRLIEVKAAELSECTCDPNRWADHAPGCKAELEYFVPKANQGG